MTVDLRKSEQAFKVSLEKRGIRRMPEIEMAVALDVSYSFRDEHRSGLTNTLLARLIPWGLTFDPDRKVDVFTFSDTRDNAVYVGEVDERNFATFVQDRIVGRVKGWEGGTEYAFVLRKALSQFGWLPAEDDAEENQGFLAWLFGRKPRPQVAKRRAIVFLVTDGENADTHEASEVVRQSFERADDVFIVLVGLSSANVDYDLLRKWDARYGNTIFREIDDMAAFVKLSDERLNDFFLDDRLAAFLSREPRA